MSQQSETQRDEGSAINSLPLGHEHRRWHASAQTISAIVQAAAAIVIIGITWEYTRYAGQQTELTRQSLNVVNRSVTATEQAARAAADNATAAKLQAEAAKAAAEAARMANEISGKGVRQDVQDLHAAT